MAPACNWVPRLGFKNQMIRFSVEFKAFQCEYMAGALKWYETISIKFLLSFLNVSFSVCTKYENEMYHGD